jgi:hypothetical protein
MTKAQRKAIAELAASRALRRAAITSSAEAPIDYAQQPNLDQVAFDKRVARMSEEQLNAAAKGLAALARSKIKSEPLD